jgi:hypothetical protein
VLTGDVSVKAGRYWLISRFCLRNTNEMWGVEPIWRVIVTASDNGNVSIAGAIRAAGSEIHSKPFLAMLGARRS